MHNKLLVDRVVLEQALETLEYSIKPLCWCWAGCEECDPEKAPDTEKTVAAIRAALAQPQRPPVTKRLPRKLPEDNDHGDWDRIDALEASLREHMAETHRLRAALAQQPEPAQEILTQKEINDLTDVHLTADIDTPVGEDEPVAWVEGAEEFARAVESAVLRKLRRQPEPVACSVNRLHIEAHRLIVDRLIAGEDYDTVLTDMGLSDTPPQRPPLTDGEIAQEVYRKWGMLPGTNSVITEFARAIERRVRGSEMSKPCEYCGVDLPLGVDKGTRRQRSFHFASCEKRPLAAPHSPDIEAQRDALLEALHHTAEIAHNGGLRSMTEWQALVLIRKLTLPFFRRSGSIVETHDRVRAAIKAAEEGKCL